MLNFVIIVLQSLSYRNNYSHFQNDSFTKFWNKESAIETVINVRLFQIYQYNVKYSTIMYKLYKVYFSKDSSKILEAENINELLKSIGKQNIIAIFKLSYFYKLLRPAEFLHSKNA